MSNINIGQLCVSNPKESNAYSRIYIAEPEKKFLEKFGRLTMLITIHFKGILENNTLSRAQDWTQDCIDFASSNFYKPLKTGADSGKEFEDVLQNINKWITKEKIQAPEMFEKYIAEINIAIISIKNNNVYFASIGDIKTHLIPADTNKLQELLSGKVKATKFSNLISGSLEQDNILFFSSSHIFDYFSTKKIIQILTEHPVQTAADKIKQLLLEEINKINLVLLIISRRDETLLIPSEESQPQTLKHTEKTTIEIDTEKEPEALTKISVKKTHKRAGTATIKNISSLFLKTFLTSFGRTLKFVMGKIFIQTLKSVRGIKKINISKPPLIKLTQKRQTINWQKTLLIILLIFGLLFIISIIVLGTQEYRAQQKKEYAQTIERLKNVESEISVALIYNDETQIQTLLAHMAQQLNQLPQKTDKQKQTYDLFYIKYSTAVNKFYRLTVVEDSQLLIDLSESYKNIRPAGMTNLFNDFYIFDSSNNYIYRFNIETKETKIVNNTSTNVGWIEKLMPLDNDILIGYDNNGGIITFNTIDNKLESVKLARGRESKQITDTYLYSDRLYVLESDQNQIYKYSKTIDGFGKEETWIKDGANIADALSFTIDSFIYVLKQSSDIYKFFKGSRTDFELSDINPLLSTADPAITNPVGNIKLFTTADMKYLYLLDGPSNRLIKLLKDGKLIKQFTSPQFNNLIDVLISRNENTAWLLNGTKIYEIEL